jgi:hypothetical protein
VQLEHAALALDAPTAARVLPALAWLRERSAADVPDSSVVHDFLTSELPRRRPAGPAGSHDLHETAWALADLFEAVGLAEQAALCRSRPVHEELAVWEWTRSFGSTPTAFWVPALQALRLSTEVPARASLSLASARALLQEVGDGLTLAPDGLLPVARVRALDDRFRWTDEFPWMRATDEVAVAPLRLIREHLVAQRLLVVDGRRLLRSRAGEAGARSTALLWQAVVDPAPRWSGEFERDVLGVVAASVLRSSDFALGRVAEEVTHVLVGKWRSSPGSPDRVFDGAGPVAQAWYQLGVPLSWWDTGRGPADRRPNALGRAAAVAVLRAVAGPSPAAVQRP